MLYILASASPRRQSLLKSVLPEFKIIPASGDEKVNLSLFPEQIACSLAESKCEEIYKTYPEATVIGCDTVVVYNGEILGKPKDKKDAESTLKRLSGKTHMVITGVCVKNKRVKLVEYDVTEVKFNLLTDEFIEKYVESGSPMDKAGSYGIQDGGLVSEYYGSYTNVMGLPVNLLKKMLKEVEND